MPQIEKAPLSARELNSKIDEEILGSSAKNRTSKVKKDSEGSSIDLENFDFKISFDKTETQELTHHLQSINANKIKDGNLSKNSEYDSDGNTRKVFSNNFFEKIKPIMKTLKSSKKYKDQAISTNNKLSTM